MSNAEIIKHEYLLALLTIVFNVWGGYIAAHGFLYVGGISGMSLTILALYGTIVLAELMRHRLIGTKGMVSKWGWKD